MGERDKTTRVGVDTGGTFTDVIKQQSDGSVEIHKLLSTPDDPSRAIGDGVSAILGPGEVAKEVIHGTTVATNALLERQGAKLAFITTRGFEDLLWMRRQTRPELYALRVQLEPPLVDESRCFGVRERLGASGEVIEALTEDEIQRVVEEVSRTDAEAVVICLLHAYGNGEHEERLGRAFREHKKEWHVTTSREVTATFREYERASTAAINGYVGPVMARYLARLTERLSEVERVEILQSHGGRVSAEHAGLLPVHTVLSGPAGGVVGAVQAAREIGIDRIISFDMGGTSTDVSLAEGEPTLTEESTIGGLPLQVPVIDIFTVGAGGGSIAYVDAGGALKVGPRSAGADPGPVAYGRGGREPTVTDAHVALGSLPADRFLGGRMTLDQEAAKEAVETLAEELNLGWRETARGILKVADSAMARAIKVISLERGHDPRDYALIAFGGAGGLHACRLAEILDMKQVLIPRFPGILSAVGMLRSEARRIYSQTILRPLDACLSGEDHRVVREMMSGLESTARKKMGKPEPQLAWTAALRYEGQSFSIAVDVDWTADVEDWMDPRAHFEAEHERLYGYIASDRGVELVDIRLSATREVPEWPAAAGEEKVKEDIMEHRRIDLGEGVEDVSLCRREGLSGLASAGPLVVTEYSGTTVIPRGWSVTSTKGHLLAIREEGA